MMINLQRFSRRIFIYLILCTIAIITIHYVSASFIQRMPLLAPILFPILTIFLLIFHLTIACFMLMKYSCDINRLYLAAIAFAFIGSALLMLGTVSSYPEWFACFGRRAANRNDVLIFYTFRNVMMAILFNVAIVLYAFRRREMHTWKIHTLILISCFALVAFIIVLSWLYSSKSELLSGFDLIDNFTYTFTPLWNNLIGWVLLVVWVLTLINMMAITQLKNIFWYGGAFFCAAYIFTLFLLLTSHGGDGYSWYQARFFETMATLFLILVLLCDVFVLYRDSRNKYINSYQNSIRDPLTRLYNRSYFYDTLTSLLPQVCAARPLSVIVCDLDHFKRINDRYGHLQGDKVIQFAASVLQRNVRQNDAAARVGGEEFALLLVNIGASDALAIAERIRLAIAGQREGLPEQMTISMGLFTTLDDRLTAEECVQRADTAMYDAKNTGRNRVVVWQE